jgi:type IV secretion system protein VirB11
MTTSTSQPKSETIFDDKKGLDKTYINPPPTATLAKEAAVRQQLLPFAEHIDNPNVVEICINKPYPAPYFIEDSVKGWVKVVDPKVNNTSMLHLANAAAAYDGEIITKESPILSTTLFNGLRMQFVMPPASLENMSVTMRRPSTKTYSLEQYDEQRMFRYLGKTTEKERDKQIDNQLVELLKADRYVEFFKLAVQAKRTMICGGETGSGKTTFMKTLCSYIPLHERLITIENARELFLPHENAVHLMYKKKRNGQIEGLTPSVLMDCTMRMRPDRVLIAELTGGEAEDFEQVCLSGHRGSITSIHSEDPEKGFERFVSLARKSNHSTESTEVLVKKIKQSIDIFLQFKTDGASDRWLSEVFLVPR